MYPFKALISFLFGPVVSSTPAFFSGHFKARLPFAAPDYMHDLLQFETNSRLYLVRAPLHCQQSVSFTHFIIRRGSTILSSRHSGQTLICAVQSFFLFYYSIVEAVQGCDDNW